MVSSDLPCSKISESQSKIYKNEIVWRFNGNRSYAEYQGLAWVAIPVILLFVVTCIEKRPAEQSFKGTNLESANKNVGHFPSQGSDRFWNRLGKPFFDACDHKP